MMAESGHARHGHGAISTIIADRVETVTAWRAEATWADDGQHGSRRAWRTTPKATGRFFKACVLRQSRDLFAGLDA